MPCERCLGLFPTDELFVKEGILIWFPNLEAPPSANTNKGPHGAHMHGKGLKLRCLEKRENGINSLCDKL